MSSVAADLKRAREARGWTQAKAAERIGVSQGYVSLLESGGRPVSQRLARSLRRTLGLSPSALPPGELNLDADTLPGVLGALGYDPFGYLRGRLANPAAVLLSALRQKDLPARVVEALPWLALRFPELNREWLVEQAKLHDVQNRLAYVVTLASELDSGGVAGQLQALVLGLEPSRLAREDTLCHDSMTDAERRWLRQHRPPQAEHWNLLTDLRPEHLPWDAFLKDLDRSLEEPVELHCLGGFVLTMLYGLKRPTADVDVLAVRPRMDLNPLAGIGSPLHKKHRVYLQLVTVLEAYPEDYEERLTEMFPGAFRHLRLFALDPYDLALTKLRRNSQRDRDDVLHLANAAPLDIETLRARYQEMRPLLGNPEREDLTLRLWIEAIEEAQKGNS